MKIKTICIGGGGFVGYAYYGALKFLKENNHLAECDTYIGTSAGAPLALIFSLELPEGMIENLLASLTASFCENDLDLLGFQNNWGVCNKKTL